MNKIIDSIRLDCGIARTYDHNTLVVCDKDGNIIDPLVGLEMFALRIIEQCVDAVLESDPSPKMIVHEPYRTIMNNIYDSFERDDNES